MIKNFYLCNIMTLLINLEGYEIIRVQYKLLKIKTNYIGD